MLPTTDPVDNEKLIQCFLATKNIEGCSKGTLSAYGFGIRKFAEFLGGFDLKDVTTDMIRIYLGNITAKNQNSYADTIRKYLNTFYQWAENEDIIFKNPCKKIKHIKCEKKMKKPFLFMERVQSNVLFTFLIIASYILKNTLNHANMKAHTYLPHHIFHTVRYL